jgi:hypothetical protein
VKEVEKMKTNLILSLVAMVLVLSGTSTVFAKKVEYRKTQNVNFDQMDVDGKAVTPNGSFVAHKPSLELVPLYKVRKNFDDNIKESVEYVK